MMYKGSEDCRNESVKLVVTVTPLIVVLWCISEDRLYHSGSLCVANPIRSGLENWSFCSRRRL